MARKSVSPAENKQLIAAGAGTGAAGGVAVVLRTSSDRKWNWKPRKWLQQQQQQQQSSNEESGGREWRKEARRPADLFGLCNQSVYSLSRSLSLSSSLLRWRPVTGWGGKLPPKGKADSALTWWHFACWLNRIRHNSKIAKSGNFAFSCQDCAWYRDHSK